MVNGSPEFAEKNSDYQPKKVLKFPLVKEKAPTYHGYKSMQEAMDAVDVFRSLSYEMVITTSEQKAIDKKADAFEKEFRVKMPNSRGIFEQGIREGSLVDVLDYVFYAPSFFSEAVGVPGLQEPVLDAFRENLEVVDQRLQENPNKRAEARAVGIVVKSIESFKGMGGATGLQLAFIDNHLEGALDFRAADEIGLEPYSVMQPIFKNGEPNQIQHLRNLILRKFSESKQNPQESSEEVKWLADNIVRLYNSRDSRESMEAEFLMETSLEGLELNSRALWSAWCLSGSWEKRKEICGDNFKTVVDLENQRPGICSILNREFGICDFARYPAEMLIRQYDERDNRDIKYGTILFAEDDYNGAFYQDKEKLAGLTDQLGADYVLRAYEVKSSSNGISQINNARKRYGRAEFSIIGAHGSPSNMMFGVGRIGHVFKERLSQDGAESLQNAYAENPTIILISCSTGAIGGIGQQISKIGSEGATVIGPAQDSYVKFMHVRKNLEGELRFAIAYETAEKLPSGQLKRIPVRAMKYHKGQLLEANY